MEKLTRFSQLVTELCQINNDIDIKEIINKLQNENNELKTQNTILKKEHQTKCQEIDNLKDEYEKKLKNKNIELEDKIDELKNFTKISYIQQLNKQLTEKNNYIQTLETQIEKSKKISTKNNSEKDLNPCENFNPANFEEINGYELLVYKHSYYLHDLETNELYDIKNNKPNNIIGLITEKGKVKLKK